MNAKFFGLQYNTQCWIGDTYGNYTKHPDIKCFRELSGIGGSGGITTMPLSGGSWTNAVYKTLNVTADLDNFFIEGSKYLGCYEDNSERALPIFLGNVVSFQECNEYASFANLTHFGLQYNTQCWGGDGSTYKKYKKLSPLNCFRELTGKGGQGGQTELPLSGGSWTNAVYLTNPKTPLVNYLYRGEVQYLGCYLDTWAIRAFPTSAGDVSSIEECNTRALNKNLTYFGLQYNKKCFIGNTTSFNQFGRRSDFECKYECSGSGRRTSNPECGIGYRNAVYKAKFLVPLPPSSSTLISIPTFTATTSSAVSKSAPTTIPTASSASTSSVSTSTSISSSSPPSETYSVPPTTSSEVAAVVPTKAADNDLVIRVPTIKHRKCKKPAATLN